MLAQFGNGAGDVHGRDVPTRRGVGRRESFRPSRRAHGPSGPARRPAHRTAALLHTAPRISVFSGAGLSKASGIPAYRDADGLWRGENAVRFSHIDDLKRDPEGFHNFWAARMAVLSEARPNPGHRALVELQMRRPSTALITQNVDGLLAEAGAQELSNERGLARQDIPLRPSR
jgi:NAD-dependent deacetylase